MKRQVLLVRRSDLALVRRSDTPGDGLVKGNLIKGLMLTSLHNNDHANTATTTGLGPNSTTISTTTTTMTGATPTLTDATATTVITSVAPNSNFVITTNSISAPTNSHHHSSPTGPSSSSGMAMTTNQPVQFAIASSSSLTTSVLSTAGSTLTGSNMIVKCAPSTTNLPTSSDYPAHLSPTSSSISSASTVDQQEICHSLSPSLEINLMCHDTMEPEPLLVVDHHSHRTNQNLSNHNLNNVNMIQNLNNVNMIQNLNSLQNMNTSSTNCINNINGTLPHDMTKITPAMTTTLTTPTIAIPGANKLAKNMANRNINSLNSNISQLTTHAPPAAANTVPTANNTTPNAAAATQAAAASQAKRPRLTNSRAALTPWKALQYHFQRHSDVKQRPDKKLTMSELSNEGLQRRNGWKVHHLVGQLDDLIDNECQMRQRLNKLLEEFQANTATIVHELAEKCKQDFAKMTNSTLTDTPILAQQPQATTAPQQLTSTIKASICTKKTPQSSSFSNGNLNHNLAQQQSTRSDLTDQGQAQHQKYKDMQSNSERLKILGYLHRQKSYGRNEFDPELIVTRIDDFLRGNLQRSSLFGNHLNDSRNLIIRITDEHKDRIARITSRSLNKRSYVRDRTS